MALPSDENVNYNITIESSQALDALKNIQTNVVGVDNQIDTMIATIKDFSIQSGEYLADVAAQFKTLDAVMSQGSSLGGAFGMFSPSAWETVMGSIQEYGAQSQEAFAGINDGLVEQRVGLDAVVEGQNNVIGGAEGVRDAYNENLDVTKAYGVTTSQALGEVNNDLLDVRTGYTEAVPAEQGFFEYIPEYSDDLNTLGTKMQFTDQSTQSFANDAKDVAPAAEEAAGGINILNTALGALTAMLTFQVINAITTTFTNAIKYAQDYYQSIVQINIAQSAMAQAGVATTQQQLLDIAKQLSTTWTNISQVQMTQAVSQAALLTTQYGLTADQVKNIANDAALLVTTGKVTDLQTGIEDIIATMKGDTSSAKWAAEVGLNFTAADFQAEALKLGITEVNGAFTDQQRAIITLALDTDNLGKTQDKATASLNTAAQQGSVFSAQWSNALQQVGQAFEPLITVILSVLIPVIENDLIPAMGLFKDVVIGDMELMLATMQTAMAGIDALWHGKTINLVQYWKDAFNSVEDYLSAAANTGGINTTVNTPVNTGAGSTSPSVAVDTTKVEDTLDTVAKDYEDYYNTVEKDTQDYNNKIDDINSKENEDLLNESQDYRVKELQQEQDFEDKMENLQAEFELKLQGDLEDRDARKVLEDTAKYNLDVQTDNNENQIRMQQDQQNENLKMQQIKENADLERQQEQRDYQQQLQDAQTSLDQKLQDEAVALQKDKGLQKTSAEDIYEILKQYYGPGGYIEQLQEYSYLSSVAMNSRLLASLQQLAHSVSTGEGIQSTQTGSGRKYAAGGIELATSATNATFGEAGPELAMFLPLNQSSIAPTFTTGLASASSQNGGTFNIIVQMDDGLVANIVEDSMNATAEVIQRSNRSS